MALDTVRKISFKPTSRRSSHVQTDQDRLARHWTRDRALQSICPGDIDCRHPQLQHRPAAPLPRPAHPSPSRHLPARTGQPRRAPNPPQAGHQRAHPRVLHRRVTTRRRPRIVFPSPTGAMSAVLRAVALGTRRWLASPWARAPKIGDICIGIPCRGGLGGGDKDEQA